MMNPLTRREMLLRSAVGLGVVIGTNHWSRAAERKFKIGACDWSLGKRQSPEAFAVAKEIGLDGVEVSFGEPGGENDLRDAAVRETYLRTVKESGVEITSLAMGVLNRIPYATDPRTESWVEDVVQVMPQVGAKRCLLAFFGNGDINGDRTKQNEVIRRLKRVAPEAEKAGVVLGIESWMSADDHLRIVNEIASPAVQVYYDVANMTKMGYDICKEIRQLGSEHICQIHMKENGYLLGQGKVDFPKVRAAIEDIGYTGWLIIEGATIRGKSLVECYRYNREYLQSVFG